MKAAHWTRIKWKFSSANTRIKTETKSLGSQTRFLLGKKWRVRVHIKLNQIKNYNCEITGIWLQFPLETENSEKIRSILLSGTRKNKSCHCGSLPHTHTHTPLAAVSDQGEKFNYWEINTEIKANQKKTKETENRTNPQQSAKKINKY